MNLLDVIVIVVAVFAALRGWTRGALGQVFELGGGFIGLLAGVAFGPRIASLFTNSAGVEGMLISLAIVFVGLSVGQALGFLIGHRFGSAARRAQFGELDSALGSGFGIGVTLVTYWLVGSLLAGGPIAPLAHALSRSKILRFMNDISEPPDVLAYIRQYLTTQDFPQVFTFAPPFAGPPVRLPSSKIAQRAISAADQSTVRVIVPACGGTQVGSGWIAAEDTVVTNAHVVAGSESVSVVEQGSDEDAATVVVFDSATDVAVLHVEDLDGTALSLTTRALERGRVGATLGYPGTQGGTLVARRAGVQTRTEARGRDIYGRREVSREIYELHASVRQGDSGGPFVLPNGQVAGVVFAASTTDPSRGYALTGAEVADEVDRGSRSSEPVSTRGCTR